MTAAPSIPVELAIGARTLTGTMVPVAGAGRAQVMMIMTEGGAEPLVAGITEAGTLLAAPVTWTEARALAALILSGTPVRQPVSQQLHALAAAVLAASPPQFKAPIQPEEALTDAR